MYSIVIDKIFSASDPCLILQVEIKQTKGNKESWSPAELAPDHCSEKDVFGTIEIPRSQIPETKTQTKLPGLIMNRMEKTLNIFQRAFNLGEDQVSNVQHSSRPPLDEFEFRKFLDPIGKIIQMKDLRFTIYCGGVEPALR